MGCPWLFLQQILESTAGTWRPPSGWRACGERDRGQEAAQSVRQRLKDDALEASTEEQAELRHWEHFDLHASLNPCVLSSVPIGWGGIPPCWLWA